MTKAKYSNPFTATFNGILDLFRKHEAIGVLNENDRIDSKVCLVTGANSGLGFAIAQQLMDRGAYVILACRSQIQETEAFLLKKYNANQFEIRQLDLCDEQNIQTFVSKLVESSIQLDRLVLNAAMVPKSSKRLANGFDEMFMVNYLSSFFLVNLLLQNMCFQESGNEAARILFISSESHRTQRSIDFNNLGKFEEYSMSKVIELYGYYKLVLNTFAAELTRNLETENRNIHVYAMCPGPVNSNIARSAPKFILPLLKVIFALFFSSPQKAAQPALFLTVSKQVENQKYLYLHLMQEKSMDEKALNPENGKLLWEKSTDLMQHFNK